MLQVNRFAHIPMASFLAVLVEAPSKVLNASNISISRADSERYDWLANREQNIVQVLENFNSRLRN